MDAGALVDMETEEGWTPLSRAAATGGKCRNADGQLVLAVRMLLERDGSRPDVQRPNSKGLTPLMWAARRGCLSGMAVLLEHGAEVQSRAGFGGGRRRAGLGGGAALLHPRHAPPPPPPHGGGCR